MKKNKLDDFTKIAKAIAYIKAHFKEQPQLEDIAKVVALSPYHFQRMFTDWAGVSPKKFLHYISVEYAKNLLREDKLPLLDAAHETGLSGTSRLHDLFINIEGMTPGEYKNGGSGLTIKYSYAQTVFGQMMLASTDKGICYMGFESSKQPGLKRLKAEFPKAKYSEKSDKLQKDALLFFQKDWSHLNELKLHLKGTPFQIKVWESLLKIPMGELVTYSDIAKLIESPQAARAVGSAIGKNPVAFIIPCHRVIRSTGEFGDYMWGADRKCAMIGWEGSQKE
ncbi:MAG: bifunctional helix-turn-helix domain-containing protein/methylated-DNA--[protein]-cysteine S-methyltransferase [Bacteriovoracaceae bacterium]|nr:bifunctional helix-turn-helix domain-containing protein/methylated-DNA--[protein]-cysteine S-methyltransferase [Bacteriovoracaceae bacterium]